MLHVLSTLVRRRAIVSSFAPTDLSGLVLWLPAAAGDVTLTSGRIDLIQDQSGADNDMESGAPFDPLWEATGLNGKPSIRPDGSNDFLSLIGAARVILSAGFTMGALIKTTSTKSSGFISNPGNTIIGDTSGAVNLGFGVESGVVTYKVHDVVSWQLFQGTTAVNDGSPHAVILTHNSSTGAFKMYVDTTASVDGSGTSTYDTVNQGFDALGNGFGLAESFDGSIRNALIYNRVLNSTELGNLMTYLVTQ